MMMIPVKNLESLDMNFISIKKHEMEIELLGLIHIAT